MPATRSSPRVTMSNASQVEKAFASAAAFRFTSSAASSSSSLTSELACSATSLAEAPRPCCSVASVGTAPPVDDLRDQDPGGDREPDDQERARPAPARLRPLAELWP